MQEKINIRTLQHQASFWVMLSGFLSKVEVENADGKRIKRALQKTCEREIAEINKIYDEENRNLD